MHLEGTRHTYVGRRNPPHTAGSHERTPPAPAPHTTTRTIREICLTTRAAMPGRAIRVCCYNHDRHGYLRIAVHRSPAASMVACATHTLTYLWAQAERAARAGRGAPGDHRVQGIARTARDRHRRKDQVALARQLCCRSLRGASTTTTPVTRKSAAGGRAAERTSRRGAA